LRFFGRGMPIAAVMRMRISLRYCVENGPFDSMGEVSPLSSLIYQSARAAQRLASVFLWFLLTFSS
jgi:hypothetical protein